ncbi:uncharacterized protein LOC115022051 isoform X1 [Cottoperca gobio]|nr:uncharacterized protein LOC115022051 isoform X1 [Cottoperca gobio]XP_029308718.1 uncharacterized protein LOC115022051 isoform X1 [Cottoperca gobio]
MYPRRSSSRSKASKRSPQRSPSPTEEVIQRRLKGKRQRTGMKKTKTDEWRDRDIIDVINSTRDAKGVAEEDEGKFVEMTDKVDELDEDCVSVTSSIDSGPSLQHNASSKKLSPSQGLCSACRTLYQKAKKMKTQMKDKRLDNDPKSLTCDQWVLIKSWRPRRLPNIKGKLLIDVQLLKKRLKVKNGAKRFAQCVREGESSACSRPHSFLERNLRRHVTGPVKREMKNRRKRTRDGSQGPRVAKQQRLHSNNRLQNISISSIDESGLPSPSCPSSSPGFEDQQDEEDDIHLTELIPTTVSLEITKPRKLRPNQKAPQKTGGFRDLLAQLRGNSSMIVKETRLRGDCV